MKPSWPDADRDKELAGQALELASRLVPGERIANIALLFAIARCEGALAGIMAGRVEIFEGPLSRDAVPQ
jgi:hypothetical protein